MVDERARRLPRDLERAVAVDVEPGAADEEHDVVWQVEDGGEGGEGGEEEDDGPCLRGTLVSGLSLLLAVPRREGRGCCN